MIRFSEVSLRRGPKLLLSEVNISIQSGDHIGIIGANGCGKSSLFSMLLGKHEADTGQLLIPGGYQISEMAQEHGESDRAAIEFVLDGDKRFRELEAAIDSDTGNADLGTLHQEFADIDGYTARSRAHELLEGLGIESSLRQQAYSEFSGGWRSRLALARALMSPGDLLLLDEPTNHLDLDATVWLEGWLRRYPGTMLLISHDRDFLDSTVSRILSFEQTNLITYRGNYSSFEQQRAQRLAQQSAEHAKQQKRIREVEAFVARFRAKATKARQAQSRLKELERMQLIAPAHVDSAFQFRLPCYEKTSSPLLSLQHASLGYEATEVMGSVDFSVLPGQRIGLLGPNGAGKSTLVKTIAGEIPILAGHIQRGENLRCGYFAQHQLAALDPAASPLLMLQRREPDSSEQDLRDFLGGYGFRGDMATENSANLSGGERSRIALALIARSKPNLLILDEPTNHLDLEMRHALTLALQEFEGAVILVSHDRHLLRNSVDEFFLVNDGSVKDFDGDLEDYQSYLREYRQEQARKITDETKQLDRREQRRLSAQHRQNLQPVKQAIADLEKVIGKLSSELEEIDLKLGNEAMYRAESSAELQTLLREQGLLRKQLSEAEEHWLERHEELETLQDE